jgi:hypothetical protein
MKRLILLLFLHCLNVQAQTQPVRTWTNHQGGIVQAALVEVSGGNVVIQLESGAKSTVPLGALSKADQDYVAGLRAAPTVSGAGTPLEWPKEAIPADAKALAVTVGLQDQAARRFHYTTGSFEFICTAPLAGTVMSEVAADFELVKLAFTRLPWGFEPKPSKGAHFQIYLTETDADYIALGGDDRSASTTSADGKSLVRFRSMGLKKVGARYQYDARQKDPGQVTNMVVHVMTESHARVFYPWSRLALEQFIRNIAYQNNGTLRFFDLDSALKKEIKIRAESNAVPNLARMVKYMRQTWLEPSQGVVQIQHEQRLDGQLLMYFFGFLDGDGRGTKWHQYCREVFKEPQVTRNADNYSRGGRLLEILIAGRDDARLGAEMAEKFKAIGVKLTP